jgi:hypothetical protein
VCSVHTYGSLAYTNNGTKTLKPMIKINELPTSGRTDQSRADPRVINGPEAKSNRIINQNEVYGEKRRECTLSEIVNNP